MKILSLGINDISNPVDGLPMYLSYFDKFMKEMGHTVLHIQLIVNWIEKDNGKVEVTQSPAGNRVINVYSPFLFDNSKSDVYKYTKLVGVVDRALSEFKPDLVFTHDWMDIPVLAMFKKKVPIIYFAHLFNIGLSKVLNTNLSDLMVQSETLGLNRIADRIICNSESEMNDISEIFPDTTPVSYWVHLGVDKDKYEYSPALDSNIILYLGRLDPQKGINFFLDSVGINKEELKRLGLKVYVAGDGFFFPQVARMDYNGDIKYLGQLRGDDKLKIMKEAKYMVFPSVYEPYGLSLNEGLSMGKICVATNVGGHKEQIKNNKNGFLVNKPEDIIKKIIKIEDSVNNRKLGKISKTARETANDIKEHFKVLWGLLNEIL